VPVGGIPLGAGTSVLAAGDMNHDGQMDLVVLRTDGSGGVLASPVLAPTWAGGIVASSAADPEPIDAAIADFNQDGWNDVVALTLNGIFVYYATPRFATPAFTVAIPVNPDVPFPAAAIASGDFDADGLPDLVVVGGEDPGYALVYLNNPAAPGAGLAPHPLGPMQTWGFEPRDVVAADFDGNGRDDFAVANRGSHTVTVFLTDAVKELIVDGRRTSERCLTRDMLAKDRLEISFGLYKLELQCGFYPVSLAAVDFDWNGKIDIAVALESTSETICPQNPSCIEVLFDPACDFHKPEGGVPPQTPHRSMEGADEQKVRESEYQICPPASATEEDAAEEGDSGN